MQFILYFYKLFKGDLQKMNNKIFNILYMIFYNEKKNDKLTS